MRVWFSILAALLFIGAARAPAAEQSRVALIIGNGAYAASPLSNPVNDATDLAARARALGFAVDQQLDADQQTMEAAIAAFTRRLTGDGKIGLFFFAGHGVEHDGRNYLIPIGARIDSEVDLRYKAVDTGQVLDGMQAAGNGLNLVVLDACRNNPFHSGFRSASRGLARMSPARGILVLYATQPGAVAQDGGGRNGVFTKHLLTAMGQPGLAVEQVFKRTAQAVDRETRGTQTPWIEGVVLGDFAFLPDSVAPAAEPLSTPPAIPLAPVPSPPPPPAPKPQLGHLQIAVDAAAQVEIDDRPVGTAEPTRPLNLTNLPAGEHRVSVKAPGYADQRRRVRVEAERWTQETLVLDKVQTPAALNDWYADWGNGIRAYARTLPCAVADFRSQGYRYAFWADIPIGRLRNRSEAWSTGQGRARTVEGCWLVKEDGLAHVIMRRKKDNKVWDQDLNFGDGSWFPGTDW